MLSERRALRSRRGGAVVVEMALVMPLFLLLLFGQLEMIRMGMVTQLLTTAAREGCRRAVIDKQTTATVTQRITEVLDGSGINLTRDGKVEILPANTWQKIKLTDQNNKITVRLSIPFSKVRWLPTPSYLNNPTLSASATLSSERILSP